jgi:hypothetical protein
MVLNIAIRSIRVNGNWPLDGKNSYSYLLSMPKKKKLGRPEKPKRERREKPLRILLNVDERQRIDDAARAASSETSTWARTVLLTAAKPK